MLPRYFIVEITSANYFIHVRGTTCLLYTVLASLILSFINVVPHSISLHRSATGTELLIQFIL